VNEFADRLPLSRPVSAEDDADREFDARLADSSTLAFRVAYSVLRHPQDAEDVAQEAFVRAHRARRQLKDRDRFRAWLVRMTWRLAMDHRRGDRRRSAREQSSIVELTSEPSSEAALIAGQQASRLWKAVDALPEKLRLVVVLGVMEEHRVSSVAALLGIPEGTVKSRLSEARRRLEEVLRGR
jgi:RNA polymerase sigma-70 factor (ECF subfamily)